MKIEQDDPDLEIVSNTKAANWTRNIPVNFHHKGGLTKIQLAEMAVNKALEDVRSGEVAKKFQFQATTIVKLSKRYDFKKFKYHSAYYVKIASDAFLPQNIMEWANDDGRKMTRQEYRLFLKEHHIDADDKEVNFNYSEKDEKTINTAVQNYVSDKDMRAFENGYPN